MSCNFECITGVPQDSSKNVSSFGYDHPKNTLEPEDRSDIMIDNYFIPEIWLL